MNWIDKARIHVEDIAWSHSPTFLFYRIVQVIDRRVRARGREDYLRKFMTVNDGECFIDVGASLGLWTFYMANKHVTVHAFEPSPRSFKRLKRMATKYRNVQVYPYALGEKKAFANLNLHYTSGHNGLVQKGKDFSGSTVRVKVRTLDSFNFKKVGLIKIDTEGYEVPILRGALQTILRNKPRLIVEIHTPYEEETQKARKLLSNHKYRWTVRYKTTFHGVHQPHLIGEPY